MKLLLRSFLACSGLILLPSVAHAEQVVCHYTYGGETKQLVAMPVASPYAVKDIAVGSYFRFRAVFQQKAADIASVKVYTYADRDEGPVLIHQATYPYPPVNAHSARYGFSGSDQQKMVDSLSGGERNRVHLARMLTSGANVILLDEPTNDLDVNVMRALEDAIANFAGCVLVISHDRWFLDRVATHILAFEGDSKIFFFNGNWSEYEADRHRRLGLADDAPPHRVQYRKLTRT